jgi:hypothetical protein
MSYLPSYKFTTSKGRTYTVVRTRSHERESVLDCVDTVVNPEGKKQDMKRSKTLELFKS